MRFKELLSVREAISSEAGTKVLSMDREFQWIRYRMQDGDIIGIMSHEERDVLEGAMSIVNVRKILLIHRFHDVGPEHRL